MKNKGIVAIFTLLMIILSIAAIALILSFKNKDTLGEDTVSVSSSLPHISVATSIEYINEKPDGSVEIKYVYTLQNTHDENPIDEIIAQTNLQETFSPHPFSIVNLSANGLTVNPSYNGRSNQQLLVGADILDGGDVLTPGQSAQIFLVINFFPEGALGPFQNYITAEGDMMWPDEGQTDGSTGESSTGGSGNTGTPPTTNTSGGSATGGETESPTGGTGGITEGSTTGETTGDNTTGESTGSETGEPGNTTGGGQSTGGTNATTGGSTGGPDPVVIGNAQISFTLSAAAGGEPVVTPSVSTLPNTSVQTIHFGIVSNIKEWIKNTFFEIDVNKILIDKIGVSSEIHEGESEETLDVGIWRMPQGSTPDQGGNTVIAGHRYSYKYSPYTFYNLDQLVVGDEIKVVWEGVNYNYKVIESKLIYATDLSVLHDKADTLTLITCISQTDDSKRLIIRAELQE